MLTSPFSFESRNTFYMLDLGSCTISSTNVSLSPSGLAFDQAFVDPTGDGSRLFMMVDEGLWPNSAPYLAVVDADASGSGSLTVSLSVPVQRSSIGIANFYDGSQYWVRGVLLSSLTHSLIHSLTAPRC